MRAALLVLAACSTAPVAKPVTPVAPAAAAAPAAPDDAAVIAKSHAFLRAHDQRDIAAFAGMVGPSFVLFEEQRFWDLARFEKQMAVANEKKRPLRTRTCKDEKVWHSGAVVVYLGLCVEELPPHEGGPSESFEGWNTLVWSQHGTEWKVAHWVWQKGGLESEREMWNETFRRSKGFKQEPNSHLVAAIKGRKPGTALDVAMGQGRNALHLAAQGWKVTGVDISDEGIRKAKETAAQRKLQLETIERDVDKFDFGTARWDLVTLIYAGDDAKTIERIKPSIKPGGLFVVEFFHEDATKGSGIGGFATGELAKLFAGWTIVTDEVVEDKPDWGQGMTKIVRFTAQKK